MQTQNKVIEASKMFSSRAIENKNKGKIEQKKPKLLSKKKQQALILENFEQARRIAWSMLSKWRFRLSTSEVDSIVGTSLCEAASRFETEKNVSFKTFYFYHLRGMLLRELGDVVEQQKMLTSTTTDDGAPTLEVEDRFSPSPEDKLQQKQAKEILTAAFCCLDDLEKEVIARHFVNEESVVDIAQSLEYCRCHVSRVKNRALDKMQVLLAENTEFTQVRREEVIEHLKSAKDRYSGGRGRRKDGQIIFVNKKKSSRYTSYSQNETHEDKMGNSLANAA